MKIFALLSLMMASWFGFSQEDQRIDSSVVPTLFGAYYHSPSYETLVQIMELKPDSTFEYVGKYGRLRQMNSKGKWAVDGNQIIFRGFELPQNSDTSIFECNCEDTTRITSTLYVIENSSQNPLFQIIVTVNNDSTVLHRGATDFEGVIELLIPEEATHILVNGGGDFDNLTIPVHRTCCQITATLAPKSRAFVFNGTWSFVPGLLFSDKPEHQVPWGRRTVDSFFIHEDVWLLTRFFNNVQLWILTGASDFLFREL